MKHTHLFFSLSFLLACSFMAHAMDTSELPPLEPKSYHVRIQEIVNILTCHHPSFETEYPEILVPKIMDEVRLVKKVILKRTNDKDETDDTLRIIGCLNWKSKELIRGALYRYKEDAIYAFALALANHAAGVEWQEVNDDGDLVTTFVNDTSFYKISMLYTNVPMIKNVLLAD